MIGNHENLQWQLEWAGTGLINTRVLVYPDEYDMPQRQLGTIVLPPDPTPIANARPEAYLIDEVPVSTRVSMDGRVRTLVGWPNANQRIVSGDTFSFTNP